MYFKLTSTFRNVSLFHRNAMRTRNVVAKPQISMFGRSTPFAMPRYFANLKGKSDKELQAYFERALKTGVQAGIKACEEILNENPTCWNAMDSASLLYGQIGNQQKAKEWADRALEGSPMRFQSHNNKGYSLLGEREYEKALHHFQIAYKLRDNPELPKSEWSKNVCNIASALSGLNRLDEARILFKKELERDPRNVDFFLNYSIILLNQNRSDEAIPFIQKFVQEPFPATQIQYEAIGALMGHLRNFNGAKTIFEALASNQKTPYLLFSLARCNYCLLNYAEAQTKLVEAISLDPENPLYHFALIECYLLVKKYDQAEQTAWKTLSLYGENVPMAVPILALLHTIYVATNRPSKWMGQATDLARQLGKPKANYSLDEGGKGVAVLRWEMPMWYQFYLPPYDTVPIRNLI